MPVAITLMMTFAVMLEVIGSPKETTTTVRNNTITGELMQTVTEKLVTDLSVQLGGRVSDFLIAFVMYWYQHLIEWNVSDEEARIEDFEKAVNAAIEVTEAQIHRSLETRVELADRVAEENATEIARLKGDVQGLETQLELSEKNLNAQIEAKAEELSTKEEEHKRTLDELSDELDEMHAEHDRFTRLAKYFGLWRQKRMEKRVQHLEGRIGVLEERVVHHS